MGPTDSAISQPLLASDVIGVVFCVFGVIYWQLWRRERDSAVGWFAASWLLFGIWFGFTPLQPLAGPFVGWSPFWYLGFLSFVSLTLGFIDYIQVPLTRRRSAFLWVFVPLVAFLIVCHLPLLGFQIRRSIANLWVMFWYGTLGALAWRAGDQEPGAGHKTEAVTLWLIPVLTLGLALARIDAAYLRYYAVLPLFFLAMTVLTATLLRRQRSLKEQVALRAEAELEMRRANEVLGQSAAMLDRTGELAQVGGWSVDLTTMKLIWTRETFRIANIEPPNEPALEEGINLFAPEARPKISAAVQAAIKNGTPYDLELPIIAANGERKWVRTQGFAEMRSGKAIRIHGTFQDITQRKAAEEMLRHNEERRSIATESGRVAIWEVDIPTGRLTWDENCFLLYGINREKFTGNFEDWLKSIHPGDLESVKDSFWSAVEGPREYNSTFRIVWPDGEVRHIEARGQVQRNHDGVAERVIGTNWDITEIKRQQSLLHQMAHFDALTGLPNRFLLGDRLQQAMVQARRRDQLLAMVYLDFDEFKSINDLHGHEIGDQFLIRRASDMKECLREADTLARIGGDEFVAILTDLDNSESCLPMLDRLLGAASAKVQVQQKILCGSASIGVAFYPQPQEIAPDQLLRQADQAMYQAKLTGKNRYHIFDADKDRFVRGHHENLEGIRLALERGEFVLHYQPKVNMRTGKVIGVEALIRWQHPEKGLLAPGVFLPAIENDVLAIAIGEWVIDAALAQIERWQALGLNLSVSVNVGARQLQQTDFVDRLRIILAKHPNVAKGSMDLEVLETSALEDFAQVSRVIKECADLGVAFALDDFGTGYSSLTYLKRLKVSVLKIDQSFVRDMLDDPDDLTILQGVIGLASAFRREVIAEGVETVAHGTILLSLGCEMAQGYGIARPMTAEMLPGWVAAWRPDPAWLVSPKES
jgi:diguanylate cyclase (GGDEF)-like protein/PAS domain S-box-containing protein